MSSLIKRRQSIHQQLKEKQDHIAALKKQLIRTQKLASLGTMTCLVAHEFNNILTPIINYADLALRNEHDHDLMKKALQKSLKSGQRASTIVKSILGLAKDQSTFTTGISLKFLIDECFQLLARDFAKDQINVEINIPKEVTITGMPGQLQQVLLNLIINARQAMLDKGGSLTINAQNNPDHTVTINVIDSGCGIPENIIEKIFDPFFTTKNDAEKPDQGGTGLGLHVCQDIIDAHNGSINVTSQPGQGTTFTITLPLNLSQLNQFKSSDNDATLAALSSS